MKFGYFSWWALVECGRPVIVAPTKKAVAFELCDVFYELEEEFGAPCTGKNYRTFLRRYMRGSGAELRRVGIVIDQ